jgi:hypothetical protein
MALTPPADTGIATRRDLEVFAAHLTAAHVKWTFTIVAPVNGLIGGLTVGYLTLLR